MNFYITDREAKEIAISVLAISFAFSVAVFGIGNLISSPNDAVTALAMFLTTIGIGFILHEMAHKVVALFYGAQAEFRMWSQGLFFMLLLSLMRFVFAAPGAVYIYAPYISKRENGIISLAGPATNLLLALVFIALAVFYPLEVIIFGQQMDVWGWGVYINLLIGFFNMLPMFPLDGSKIIAWNFFIWLGAVCVFFLFGFVFLPFDILGFWAMMLVFTLLLSGILFGRRGF